MTDTDKLTFGKYEGTMLQDVPSTYLHYLWEHGKRCEPRTGLHQYIKRSILALKAETQDRIWTPPEGGWK